MSATTLQTAEWLCEQRGYSVIPLDHPAETNQTDPKRIGKVPRLQTWKMFQEARPTRDNLRAWFGNGHRRNIGLVTGAVSNLVMIDLDSPEALTWADAHLPPTPMVTRTAQGEHRGYRHPGVPVRNKARVQTGDPAVKIDVRADGGYVVGPTSLHASGVVYERAGTWPPVAELPVFDPAWLEPDAPAAEPETADTAPPRQARRTPPAGDEHARVLDRARAYLAAMPPAVQGQGGDTHTLVAACRIVRGFDLDDADALELLREWNRGCVPPWSDDDLTKKIRSARVYGKEPIGGLRDTPRPDTGAKSSTRRAAAGRDDQQARQTRTSAEPSADDRQTTDSDDSGDVDDFVRDQRSRSKAFGAIIASNIDNVRLGLRRLGVSVVYDQFIQEVRLNGEPLTDRDIERLWVQFDDTFHFRPSKDLLRTVISTEADAHAVHPVREYLDGLSWDGTPRLDRWLITYAGASDTPYVRAVGALPLLAAARRVRQPGAQFHELLILEGARQGTGKSSAVAALCPCEAWFSDDVPLGSAAKELIERTSGHWIIEAAELVGFRGREAETLKSFLSRREDVARLAYGRLATRRPRQFILIGTTNTTSNYLTDSTGNRRFWPVRVQWFDLDALRRDRDQLWAEAATREAAGASIRLDPALWAEAATEQEARREADPWEAVIGPLFEGDGITRPDRVSVDAVWRAIGMETEKQNRAHAKRIADIAQRYSFTPGRPYLDGRQTRCWVREDRER